VTLYVPHFALIVGALTTFMICQVIVLTQHLHSQHTMDTVHGIQKVHVLPTPRVGGIAIIVGLMVSWYFATGPMRQLIGPVLIASVPAFVSGTVEDISKRGSVAERLLATIASGLIAWLLTGISVRSVDIWGVDMLLSLAPISIVLTAIAVGGVANSINIIDGVNGLAGATVILCVVALGLMAYAAGDVNLTKFCIIVASVTGGFMLVNYPLGKIFLGDGGAYLLGFLLGWISVMLIARNGSISPWAPLVACAYPVLEVLFSMLRRFARTRSLSHPDRLHLHSLVWARVVKIHFPKLSQLSQNSLVLPFMMLYAVIPSGLAVIFRANTLYLALSFLFCAGLYALVYMRLVRFRWF
jgi:UDP-N-acetylmuramyl pentapeptide phosphotransferase/UDP-N-acetylglucosamine-1-phosphate transferase